MTDPRTLSTRLDMPEAAPVALAATLPADRAALARACLFFCGSRGGDNGRDPGWLRWRPSFRGRTISANGWIPERRARQAALIRQWRPWDQSTGPRSAAGKARASRNADKGGHRERLRALVRDLGGALKGQGEALADCRSAIEARG